jgi:hypothetical protein
LTDDRLRLIERNLAVLEDSLEKLTDQLGGDGTHLAPGVVGILARHDDRLKGQAARLTRIERTIDRFRWTLAGASAVGGLLGGGAVALFGRITETL